MRVVLVGGGGHASDVLGVFEARFRADDSDIVPVIGIVDDSAFDQRRFAHRDVGQIGNLDSLDDHGATHYILAVGFSAQRRAVWDRVRETKLSPVSVIHPLADVPPDCHVGDGTVILSGTRMSPLVSVGEHVYLSHGCLIGHDCRINDFATILPGAAVSGDTDVGRACTVGSNATVLEGVTLGEGSLIGAGAVVTRDVGPGEVVVGNPARPLKSL